MKLVFLGGVHGVGKTTVLERVIATSSGRLYTVDPGELFWEHVYQKKDKTPDEAEVLAAKLIERECRLHPLVVCNWHYAVWTPSGYVLELALPKLATLIEKVRPECVYLVLVTASADAVFERREKDRAIKKRKVDRLCVEEEMAQTEVLYRLHHDVVSQRAKTVSVVFDNTGPISAEAIEKLAKTLYETS